MSVAMDGNYTQLCTSVGCLQDIQVLPIAVCTSGEYNRGSLLPAAHGTAAGLLSTRMLSSGGPPAAHLHFCEGSARQAV